MLLLFADHRYVSVCVSRSYWCREGGGGGKTSIHLLTMLRTLLSSWLNCCCYSALGIWFRDTPVGRGGNTFKCVMTVPSIECNNKKAQNKWRATRKELRMPPITTSVDAPMKERNEFRGGPARHPLSQLGKPLLITCCRNRIFDSYPTSLFRLGKRSRSSSMSNHTKKGAKGHLIKTRDFAVDANMERRRKVLRHAEQ